MDLQVLRTYLWSDPAIRPLMQAIREAALRDTGHEKSPLFLAAHRRYAGEVLRQLDVRHAGEERPGLIQVNASLFTQTFVR